MSIERKITYTCNSCGAKATSNKDREKGSKWFNIKIKVYFGCDKKDLTEGHVCSFKCAYDLMVVNKNSISTNWVEMKELFS